MIIKNSNLRRNLFGNRYKILAIIVAIILVLSVIRVLNEMAKQAGKEQNKTSYTNISSTYKPQETVILGDNVSKSEQENNTKIMDEFIRLCNAKEVEKAYALLTDECKEEVFYSNIEIFKKDYVEKIFDEVKIYNMQSWINASNPTYKVRILNDVLSTGKSGKVVEEYYTIVKQDDGYKLNLNSYIGRTKINKQVTQNNITVTVISKDTFMDYETYNIKVENNTNNTILLDTKTNQDSVYITGNNDITTYNAFMYEIDDFYLTIEPEMYTNISITFNKIYSSSIKAKSLTFTEIVTNLEQYQKDKQNYNDKLKIEVNF